MARGQKSQAVLLSRRGNNSSAAGSTIANAQHILYVPFDNIRALEGQMLGGDTHVIVFVNPNVKTIALELMFKLRSIVNMDWNTLQLGGRGAIEMAIAHHLGQLAVNPFGIKAAWILSRERIYDMLIQNVGKANNLLSIRRIDKIEQMFKKPGKEYTEIVETVEVTTETSGSNSSDTMDTDTVELE